MKEKVKVIYIMGEGRSGSTLLDLLLGTSSNCVGLGEFWSFYTNDPTLTGDCACGATVKNCRFWGSMKNFHEQKTGVADLETFHRERLKEDKITRLIYLAPFGRAMPSLLYQYCVDATYRCAAEISGVGVVVDSTKHVGRAFNLSRCEEIDLYVIHLVRDGRAVIWSRLRDRKGNNVIKNKGPLVTSAVWTIKNCLAFVLTRKMKDKAIRVWYEDLINEPAVVIKNISDRFKIDFSDAIMRLENGEGVVPSHQIGGNMRARSGSNKINLRVDDEWRASMPRYMNWLFLACGGWLSFLLRTKV